MTKYKRNDKGQFMKGTPQPYGFGKGKQKEPWNKGKNTGLVPSTAFKKGHVPWHTGLTKETDERISNSFGDRYGEKNPNWKCGISFEPYPISFNCDLKERIRKRDNYTCQECGYGEDELGYRLSIHHIDYNKKNNKDENLISLCKVCHSRTNSKRKEWSVYFRRKMERD